MGDQEMATSLIGAMAPSNNGTCPLCPGCNPESAAKAIYGLTGVAVFITVKYFWPNLKKFSVRIFGSASDEQKDGEAVRMPSFQRLLPAMMPEITKLIQVHEAQ
jgi:hypothetical protein